jgi:hypothetical protein
MTLNNNQKNRTIPLNFGVIFETPQKNKTTVPLSLNVDNRTELNNLKAYMAYSIKKHQVKQ